jgi:hypothetical protein
MRDERRTSAAVTFVPGLVLALCLAILVATPAGARRGFGPPIGVRIVGYVGEVPSGVRPQYTWKLRERDHEYSLAIEQLSARGGVLPGDIDSALVMYEYRLLLTGDQRALERFRAAAPQQRVTIDGYLRLQAGARYLMLDNVEIAATPVPPR